MAAFKPRIYRYEGMQYSVPAQVVGETCERLEAEYGEVTRQNLLDASRDNSSPTHNLFEWRDDVAAEKYRLIQSGKVLACLKFTIVTEEKKEKNVRAFMNVNSTDSDASFRSFEVAMSKVDLRSEVLKRALRELEIFKEKYSTLTELSKVFEAISDVQKKEGEVA